MLDEVLGRILRHNVRNDLSVIRGRATLLEETGSPAVVDHAVSIVDTADDILSTAASAAEIREVVDRRRESTTVELSALVEPPVREVIAAHPEAEISIQELPDRQLTVHPCFEYAVYHAVENSVKHNEGHKCAEVRVSQSEDYMTIEVEDNGDGVPPSELEPLSSHEETQLVHGSGAGLWILDRVVRYSGGSVVFDADGTGTTVRMTLVVGADD